MERLLVLGGGGHAAVVLDAVRAAGRYEPAGLVVAAGEALVEIDGVPTVGTDDDLERLFAEGVAVACVVAVGSTGRTRVRRLVVDAARAAGFSFPAVVHPSAVVAPSVEIAEGAFVGPGAVVGVHSSLGAFCIVNSGAVIDHDGSVGEFAHVAPGAALSGGVTVGADAHVGTGASVANGIRIGARALVGVGSAVIEDVPRGYVAYGVPCKAVRPNV